MKVRRATDLQVEDPETAEAQERGYEIVHPLGDEEWGVRRCYVRAPDGTVVNVVQHHH